MSGPETRAEVGSWWSGGARCADEPIGMSPTTPDAGFELRGIELRMQELCGRVEHLVAAVESTRGLSALGVLAASIAHELNNMLTPIRGYAQAALARPDDLELMRRALERAADASDRAGHLVRSILDLAGEVAADQENENRTSTVRSALDSAASSVTHGGSSAVRVEARGEIDLPVRIGRAALVQVFENLILNAARAMGSGGGVVRIDSAVEGGGIVVVTVADTGPGISPEVRERLFRPFATASMEPGTHAGSQRGTGLGLSICRRLIETSGGSIDLDSASGGGATFRLRLRRA